MQLVKILLADKESYNRFVALAPSGSFLQSWEWGEWQASLGRTVYRFKITDDSGEQVASVQLFKMTLPFGKYYLYAPYGPIIDLRFKIEDLRFLIQKFNTKFPDAIFIRIEPKNNEIIQSLNHSIFKSSNVQPGKTLVLDLLKTEGQLLAEMHPKTRYNIKLAQKHGVKVEKDLVVTPGFGLYFKEVLEQIIFTQKRQGFKGYGREYYKQLVDFFALNHKASAKAEEKYSGQSAEASAKADGIGNPGEVKLHIYKALFQNHLLSSAIMVDFSAKGGSPAKGGHSASGGGTRTYLFGGSSEENKNLMAPYALHWQAILDAKQAGQALYDFWGIETSSGNAPGFARFKLGFGGKTLEYGGAVDIVYRKAEYRIYKLLRAINLAIKKNSPR